MNYFEGKNTQEKSYIDFNSVVDGIDESVSLIFDLEKINTEKLKEIFDLYKNNLDDIKYYIEKAKIYSDTDKIKEKIEKTIENINSYKNIDSYEKDGEAISTDTCNDGRCNQNVIGVSVGNNRYISWLE